MIFTSPLLALALANLANAVSSKNLTRTYGNSTVSWQNCGKLVNKTLECATIHVPYDHWAAKPSVKTFSVPLVRMLTHYPKAETMLLNPGGPGGSGIQFLQDWGSILDKIFEGRFHLLGFDPRGVAASHPQAKCMPDDDAGASSTAATKYANGPLVPSEDWTLTLQANSGDYSAIRSNYAKLCNDTIGEFMSYMNSPQTAVDMNSILDAIGEWKLNYFGGSYGTLLGATYAQLFPERVGKMALNGVIDFTRYWSRIGAPETISVDDAVDEILGHCLHERATCPLADGYDNVASLRLDIEHKLDALDIDPADVYFNATAYGAIRGSDARFIGVFFSLYSPKSFPALVRSLAYLLKNDYHVPYLHWWGGQLPGDPRQRKSLQSILEETEADSPDAFNVINRSDKSPANLLHLTRKQLADTFVPNPGYFDKDFGIVDTFSAATWVQPRSHNFTPAAQIWTPTPVLLLSSKFDPVTPLSAARATNEILKDSVLLVQDSIGHTTLSKPSKCSIGYMKRYFLDGTLPAPGTVCGVDDPTYFSRPDVKVSKITAERQDRELEEAMSRLAEYAETHIRRHWRHL